MDNTSLNNSNSDAVKDTVPKSKESKESFLNLFKSPAATTPARRRRTPKRMFEEDQGRPRTPSGQVLSSTVYDIKEALFKKAHKESPSENITPYHDQSVGEEHANQLFTLEETPDTATAKSAIEVKECDYRYDAMSADTIDRFLELERIKLQRQIKAGKDQNMSQQSGNPGDNEGNQIKDSRAYIEDEVEDTIARWGDNSTMDIRTVVQMMQELRTQMQKDIRAEFQKMKEGGEIHKCKATEELRFLQAKVEVCQLKERMMIGTMSNMRDQMKDIQEKLENIEIANNKRMVILSGLIIEGTKKAECRRGVEMFISDMVGQTVEVDDVYYIGNASPRDIVITLQNMSDKRHIFQNVDHIKNMKNAHGKKYFFRDYLTASQNEKKKKGQHIADVVNNREAVNKEDVTSSRTSIFVGEKEYKKLIKEPDATRVLNMPLQMLNEILAAEVDRYPEVTVHKGNRFTGYSLCTNSIEDIQKVYMKLCLNHAEARHIVCCWNVPGVNEYESADSCDDGELGVSLPILQMMLQNQVENRAIFTVRNYGEKLYSERIPQYKSVAKKIIEAFPFNSITNKQQQIIEDEAVPEGADKTYAGVVKTPPGSRGRARGRATGPAKTNARGRGRGRGGSGARGRPIRARGGRGRKEGQFQYSTPRDQTRTEDVDHEMDYW